MAPVDAGVRNTICVLLEDEMRELTSCLLKNKTGWMLPKFEPVNRRETKKRT